MQKSLGRYRDAVFFASGFSGLVYESIWTHYLKLFLGHAAFAQTLVLGMYMGGMAVGAALAARYTVRIGNPLKTYAIIEAAIGALALLFHPIFVGTIGGFYDLASGSEPGGAAFAIAKYGLAGLLILPQTILLGATFPVFAAAAARAAPEGAGRSIATLYFANGIGAAAGALVAGFVLVPALGLPGTVAAAGAVNLAIAAVVMVLAGTTGKVRAAGRAVADETAAAIAIPAPNVPAPRPGRAKHAVPRSRDARRPAQRPSAPAPAVAPATPAVVAPDARAIGARAKLIVAVAFLTGASSFIYEVGWIRMLSLVLGSATHSFELMLSSFVLGLALGGLWIRSRVDTTRSPGRLLAWIQIVMGFAALATVPLHSATFDLLALVLREAPRTGTGYAAFNLVRYGIASLIMFPAAFCAGMTLPVATRLLYTGDARSERAIGLVYGANTAGAIAGLVFAVHVALPAFGLDYLVASGAAIDVAIGAVLLIAFGGRSSVRRAVAAVAACAGATAAVATTFDPQKLTSGVFRTAAARTNAKVLAIAHGKTASISVDRAGDLVTLRTNGKPDASANLDPASAYAPDLVTQTLLGAIPLMLHASPRRVANIGLGSGITGETILADPRVLHLDTIEIEPRVVDLAKLFAPLNRGVYEDPRSAIHVDDAKSYFAANGQRYDLIVSEPSNPWVSGVASLFSVEFYRHVAGYLNDGGLFAQWLQTYETHPDRVISVLKAMAAAFDDYVVIALDDGDILLVGARNTRVAVPDDPFARVSPQMRQRLRHIDVANAADILFRVIGNRAVFTPWLDARPVAANSDYAPYLDANADRDRFLGRGWADFDRLPLSGIPLAEILGGRPALPTPSALSFNRQFGPEPAWLAARLVRDLLLGPAPEARALPIPAGLPQALVRQGRQVRDLCANPPPGDRPFASATIATRVLPYLSPAEGRDVLAALGDAACVNDAPGAHPPWSGLLAALADRNARSIGAAADALLVRRDDTTDSTRGYVLAMAVLGHLGTGEHVRARAAWETHSRDVLGDDLPELAFQILRDHALSAPRGR